MKLEVFDTSTEEQIDNELFVGNTRIQHSADDYDGGYMCFDIKADADKIVITLTERTDGRFKVGTFKVYNWSEHLPSNTLEAFGIAALNFHSWLHTNY